MKKRLTILGSTGSIGQNALRVVARNPDRFELRYLSAGQNSRLLSEQARQLHPKGVAIAAQDKAAEVAAALKGSGIEVYAGPQGIHNLAAKRDVDLVLNAIVGSAGLAPSHAALAAGKDLALSNKESLVMAGELLIALLSAQNVRIFPVDSEHSAIWQCLQGEKYAAVRRLILTGSGGPFRNTPLSEFDTITPQQALRHPTWNMGRKITIDSATMMNKGLEIIEAHWLFRMPVAKIDVVIHPQSIIHSMVEFIDGSVKAQLGLPDMKLPIQYALGYPERLDCAWEQTDFSQIRELQFETPDQRKFPALGLARAALQRGGTAPAILNVVNEWAVYAFLENRIKFTDIPRLVEKALGELTVRDHPSLEDIFATEQSCRDFVEREVSK